MNKYLREREEVNRSYNKPENRRLRNVAIAVIGIGILLLLSMIFWMDKIPYRVMLIMRGCAGLAAIIFVVLVGILTYRVNKQHIINRRR